MKIRLSAATLGVVGLAYVWDPFWVMCSFMFLVGMPVTYSAWVSQNTTPTLHTPTDSDE